MITLKSTGRTAYLSGILVLTAGILLFAGCGKSPDDLYTEGKTLLTNEETFEEGVAMLNTFMEKYPEDPRSPEVGVAIASSLQAHEEYDRAAAAYTRVIEEYPETAEAYKSLFLLGYLQYEQGDAVDEARATLERFVTEYPDSELAMSARVLLENLGKPLEEWSIIQDMSPPPPVDE